jgi:glucans biosynthesis protein
MRCTVMRLIFALAASCPLAVAASGFEFQHVIDKARALAAQPYKAPPTIPRFMRELAYDQYQDIRFDPERSLWRESDSRFQVMFFSAGLYYAHPVAINVIDADGVHAVPYRKSWFTFADAELERRVPADLGFAGFKLAFPLIDGQEHNQFLVFAGASYFRGVGRDNAWGISGRGIAVDTGLPSGEEFPSFIEFWLERPAPGADALRFYGLLDGESLTGAYRFTAYPGTATRLEVEAVLFARDTVELLGVAPLTSMFFYGENTARPAGEWRREVHDSDGLLIHDGATGEWLWRPLVNPVHLEMDFFRTGNVRGFGLLQRDTEFASYHDLGARYERRPSAWVAPRGEWGPGEVVLVQIPTASETNDNIVAFWTPATKAAPAGEPLSFAYTVSFGAADVANTPMGRAVNTFVGDGNIIGGGNVEGAYRFIVDFAGGPLDKLKPRAAVVGTVSAGEGGEVIEHFVEYNDALRTWRLSILARPAAGKPLELRAFLREGDAALTETWTYRLPAINDIRARSR